jgi:uncharacterized protein YqjF (DUF2071 family)
MACDDHQLRSLGVTDGDRPWIMQQRWEHVLFCHWRYPVEVVRSVVPEGLDIDTRDGSAWVSVVPLRLAHVHLRDLPPLPDLSHFAELNVRTYVTRNGEPGVWFLSIDAGNSACSWIGRCIFHAPYHDAEVRLDGDGPYEFSSDRGGGAKFDVRYEPTGDPFQPESNSLELFLSERYAMFVRTRTGRVLRGSVRHDPWVLQHAVADITVNTALEAAGLPAPANAPLTFYSEGTNSDVCSLERV